MLLIWNPAVFGPFLLSMVVIQCTTVKKLFVSFCWRWLCLRIWRQWGLIHLGVVNDCGGGQLTIDILDMFLFLHPLDQWPKWEQSIAKSRYEKGSFIFPVRSAIFKKSSPWKSQLICPSGNRIKSNKTPGPKSWSWSWKSWRPPLKGWFASLKGRSHLICGPLQTTSNATKPSLHPPYNWYGQADKKNTDICMVFKCTDKQLLVSLCWICFQKLVKCKSSKKKIYRRQYGLVIHWITTWSN